MGVNPSPTPFSNENRTKGRNEHNPHTPRHTGTCAQETFPNHGRHSVAEENKGVEAGGKNPGGGGGGQPAERHAGPGRPRNSKRNPLPFYVARSRTVITARKSFRASLIFSARRFSTAACRLRTSSTLPGALYGGAEEGRGGVVKGKVRLWTQLWASWQRKRRTHPDKRD